MAGLEGQLRTPQSPPPIQAKELVRGEEGWVCLRESTVHSGQGTGPAGYKGGGTRCGKVWVQRRGARCSPGKAHPRQTWQVGTHRLRGRSELLLEGLGGADRLLGEDWVPCLVSFQVELNPQCAGPRHGDT